MASSRKKWFGYLFTAALSLILIFALLVSADINKVSEELSHSSLSLIIIAALLYLSMVFVRTVRWYILLKGAGQTLPFRSCLPHYAVGQALNDVTPGRVLGDAVRAAGISEEEEGVSIGASLSTLVYERVMDMLFTTIALVASFATVYIFGIYEGTWDALALLMIIIVFGNLLVVGIISHPAIAAKVGAFGIWVSKALKNEKDRERFANWVDKTVASFNEGRSLSWKKNRKAILTSVFLTILIWCMEFTRMVVIFDAIGSTIFLSVIVLSSIISFTAQLIFPAGGGNMMVVSEFFQAAGLTSAVAATAGLLSIITSIWLMVPIALCIFVLKRGKYGTRKGRARQQQVANE